MAEKGSKTVVNGQKASLLGWLRTIFGPRALRFPPQSESLIRRDQRPCRRQRAGRSGGALGSTIRTLETMVTLPGTQPDMKRGSGPSSTLRGAATPALALASRELGARVAGTADLLLTPLSVQAVTNAQDLVHRLIDSLGAAGAAVQPAAKTFNTVFDMLGPDALGAATPLIQAAANSVLPGTGGAAATIGIGLLTSLFSNRAVQAQVDDHRTGANLRI